MSYTLNAEQSAAVKTTHHSVLVLASPGSGKTRSLVERVFHLVANGANPARIVVITFTNNAADEIRNRLTTGYAPVQGIGYIGTLHGYCLRLLGRYGESIGFRHNLTVIDEERASLLLEESMKQVGYKIPTKELEAARRELGPRPQDAARRVGEKAALVVARYYQQLKRGNAIDYDGLLVEALAMLHKNVGCPDLVPRIEHLLVDEYQDSAVGDQRIYRALSPDNTWIVGDPDQGIFSFRGGSLRLILDLARDPMWEKHFFLANYRSDDFVCKAANRLIARNRNRVGKTMHSVNHYNGALWSTAYDDEDQEVQGTFWQVANLHDHEGCGYGEMAILVRTNALAKQFRDGAKARSVPVAKETSPEYDVPGWKFARATVDMLASPTNDFLFHHWLSQSQGKEQADGEAEAASLNRASIASHYFIEGIPPTPTLAELPARLLDLGVTDTAIRALDLLLPTLPAGAELPEVSLAMRSATASAVPGGAPGGITITTIHAAKGREWNAVFMPAMEYGILPGARAIKEEGGFEEERRLAFVGATRAARRLFLSWSKKRAPMWGRRVFAPTQVSPFFGELLGE